MQNDYLEQKFVCLDGVELKKWILEKIELIHLFWESMFIYSRVMLERTQQKHRKFLEFWGSRSVFRRNGTQGWHTDEPRSKTVFNFVGKYKELKFHFAYHFGKVGVLFGYTQILSIREERNSFSRIKREKSPFPRLLFILLLRRCVVCARKAH